MGSFNGALGGFAKGFRGGYQLGLASREQDLQEYQHGKAPDDEVIQQPGIGGGAIPETPEGGVDTTKTGSTTGGDYTDINIESDPEAAKVLGFIRDNEAGKDPYNKLVGGKTGNLTNMTVGEVLNYQQQMLKNGHETTALGAYQFINSTLANAVQHARIPLDTKFDQATQDKLGYYLLQQRGWHDYKSGKISKDAFMDNLASEWAILPLQSGKSKYAGVGSNAAGVTRDVFSAAVPDFSGGTAVAGTTTPTKASTGVADAVTEQGGDPDSPTNKALADLKAADEAEESGAERADANVIPVPEEESRQVADWKQWAAPEWQKKPGTLFAAEGGTVPAGYKDAYNSSRAYTQISEPSTASTFTPRKVGQAAGTTATAFTPRKVGQTEDGSAYSTAYNGTTTGQTASQKAWADQKAARAAAPVEAAPVAAAAPVSNDGVWTDQMKDVQNKINQKKAVANSSGQSSTGIQQSNARALGQLEDYLSQLKQQAGWTTFAKGGKVRSRKEEFEEQIRRETRGPMSQHGDPSQQARDTAARRINMRERGVNSTALDPNGYWQKPTKPRVKDTPRKRKAAPAPEAPKTDETKTGSTTLAQPATGNTITQEPGKYQPKPGRLSDENAAPPKKLALPATGDTITPEPEDEGAIPEDKAVFDTKTGWRGRRADGPAAPPPAEGPDTQSMLLAKDEQYKREQGAPMGPGGAPPAAPAPTAPDANSMWKARDEEYKRRQGQPMGPGGAPPARSVSAPAPAPAAPPPAATGPGPVVGSGRISGEIGVGGGASGSGRPVIAAPGGAPGKPAVGSGTPVYGSGAISGEPGAGGAAGSGQPVIKVGDVLKKLQSLDPGIDVPDPTAPPPDESGVIPDDESQPVVGGSGSPVYGSGRISGSGGPAGQGQPLIKVGELLKKLMGLDPNMPIEAALQPLGNDNARFGEIVGQQPPDQSPRYGYAEGGVIPDDPTQEFPPAPPAPPERVVPRPVRQSQEPDRPEPQDVQPTPLLLDHVGQAIRGGIDFLKRTFGLDGGGGAIDDPNSQQLRAQGGKRLIMGEGAADQAEIQGIDDKIDPQRQLSEGDRHMQRMAQTMQWYLMNGRKEDAEGAAASLIQYGSKRFGQLGAMAGAAYKKYQQDGDPNALEDAMGYLEKAYEFIPDGGDFDVLSVDPKTGKLMTVRRDAEGNEETIEVDAAQLPQLLQQVQSGSAYWKEIGRLADPEGSRQEKRFEHEDKQAKEQRELAILDRDEKRKYENAEEDDDRKWQAGEHDRQVKLQQQVTLENKKIDEALLRSRPTDKKTKTEIDPAAVREPMSDYYAAKRDYDAVDANDEEGLAAAKKVLDTAGTKLWDAVGNDAEWLKKQGIEIGETGFTPTEVPPKEFPNAQKFMSEKTGKEEWHIPNPKDPSKWVLLTQE